MLCQYSSAISRYSLYLGRAIMWLFDQINIEFIINSIFIIKEIEFLPQTLIPIFLQSNGVDQIVYSLKGSHLQIAKI